MILNKNDKETDSLMSLNNDIYRIISIFNQDQDLKKLLIYTDSKPLYKKDTDKDLRDAQIGRAPLLPYDEEEGSLVTVTLIQGDKDFESNALLGTIAIDVFTPGNQWIINDGIRPLLIANRIDNLMRYKVNQTDGVKYRLESIINSQLSDILVGYRMIYRTIIDE